MRMSQEEKVKSRARILGSASRLFRERGLDGASVADVMQDADMTHGGFYKHFESKDALLAAALDQAFAEIAEKLEPAIAPGAAQAIASEFQDFYLSDGHKTSPGCGCPVAALGGDIARMESELKAQFGAGIRRITNLLASGLPGSERVRQSRAIQQFAMMAGAIMIARASDPNTAHDVLAACRERKA